MLQKKRLAAPAKKGAPLQKGAGRKSAAKKPAMVENASTKDRILDAAQSLFAEHGYYGTSIRDITAMAGVDLARVNYHFGTKDELFRQVVTRGSSTVAAAQLAALDAAKQGSVETILRAFIGPILEPLKAQQTDWRNFLKLSSHLQFLSGRPDLTSAYRGTTERVVPRFTAALAQALPDMPEETVHAGFSLVRQSMRGIVAIYTEAEPIAAAEGGHFSTTLSLEIGPLEVEPLVEFFAAGILRLAETPLSRRRKDAKP